MFEGSGKIKSSGAQKNKSSCQSQVCFRLLSLKDFISRSPASEPLPVRPDIRKSENP